METYLQSQDLWEIIDGSKVTSPEDGVALKKWKIWKVKVARQYSRSRSQLRLICWNTSGTP